MSARTLATLIIAVATLQLTAPASAREMAATGDILFYLDKASFLGQQGRVLQEVYIRIPNSELSFEESKKQWRSRVKLSVLIADLDGKHVIEDAKEMTFVEDDPEHTRVPVYFQTVIKRYQLLPGTYVLSYAVEDLQAQKMSLKGVLHRKNRTSAVRNVRLNIPGFAQDEPSFSDAKFVWSTLRVGDRVETHPNPTRLYGLHLDTMAVYMELYLPDEMATSPTFEFRSEILDAGSEIAAESRIDLPNPGKGYAEGKLRAYPVHIREDLSRFPAGVYTLWVSFGLDGHVLRRVRCGEFSVAWDMRTWEVPRREYLAEARFLMGDDQFEEFQMLDLGDQERRLGEMWAAIDPTPEVAGNESYDEFLVRLAHINDHYSEGGEPAILSQRGRLYVRYGAPDEVIEDVVPINRETVEEAIETISDRFHTFNFSSQSVKPATRSTRSVITDPRNLGARREGDHSAYAFELWVYHTSGVALLDRDRASEMDMGMRFLFLDREGYGRYRLESSNSITNK